LKVEDALDGLLGDAGAVVPDGQVAHALCDLDSDVEFGRYPGGLGGVDGVVAQFLQDDGGELLDRLARHGLQLAGVEVFRRPGQVERLAFQAVAVGRLAVAARGTILVAVAAQRLPSVVGGKMVVGRLATWTDFGRIQEEHAFPRARVGVIKNRTKGVVASLVFFIHSCDIVDASGWRGRAGGGVVGVVGCSCRRRLRAMDRSNRASGSRQLLTSDRVGSGERVRSLMMPPPCS
jgi:hypothetical protein